MNMFLWKKDMLKVK